MSVIFRRTIVPTSAKPQAISYAHNLIAELAPVAVEATHRFAGAENRVDDLLRKDAGQQRADRAARAVHAEGIEGIVVAEDRLHFRDHEIADQPGDKSDRQRGHGCRRIPPPA